VAAQRPTAQKAAILKALETAAHRKVIVRVSRGVYRAGIAKSQEPIAKEDTKGKHPLTSTFAKPTADGPALSPRGDGETLEKGMVRLKIAAREALAEFDHGVRFTRVAWLQKVREADAEMVESLEDGEFGGVVRALQMEGKVRLVTEPGAGKMAEYER
jgi:hypothetical protein